MINLIDKVSYYTKTNTSYTTILQKYKNFILGIDHIAFRSLYKNKNKFEHCILQPEIYSFPQYNVLAHWYKNKKYKRIFNSYYKGNDFPYIIQKLDTNRFGDLFTYEDYQFIYKQNQYIAWTMLHGNYINHIALEVVDIYELMYIMRKDYSFNNNNDKIYNVSQDKQLIQSSTIAITCDYQFKDGIKKVPYTFIEFVQRINGRDGFTESNANNIMHSTKVL